MKIYTKTGDKGETALYGGTRVSKASARVDSYGNIDELNSFIGIAKSHIANEEVLEQLKKNPVRFIYRRLRSGNSRR